MLFLHGHVIHDHVVTHHRHVFMFEDVTVIHIHTHMRSKGHGDLDAFAGPDKDSILPSSIDESLVDGRVAAGWRSGPLDDLELNIVHMHGMRDGCVVDPFPSHGLMYMDHLVLRNIHHLKNAPVEGAEKVTFEFRF